MPLSQEQREAAFKTIPDGQVHFTSQIEPLSHSDSLSSLGTKGGILNPMKQYPADINYNQFCFQTVIDFNQQLSSCPPCSFRWSFSYTVAWSLNQWQHLLQGHFLYQECEVTRVHSQCQSVYWHFWRKLPPPHATLTSPSLRPSTTGAPGPTPVL